MRKKKAVVKIALKLQTDFFLDSLSCLEEVQSKDYNVDHVEEKYNKCPILGWAQPYENELSTEVHEGTSRKVSKTVSQKPGCSMRGKKYEIVHSSRDNFEARRQVSFRQLLKY